MAEIDQIILLDFLYFENQFIINILSPHFYLFILRI